MNQILSSTLITEYIIATPPWAHGHQVKTITTFVGEIFEAQTIVIWKMKLEPNGTDFARMTR
jgi:hypothetical protein